MTDPEKDEGLIPDAIEDRIIDALVSWLKGSLLVVTFTLKPLHMRGAKIL